MFFSVCFHAYFLVSCLPNTIRPHWYHLVVSTFFLKMYSHLHVVIICLSKFYYLCMMASFLDYFEGIACDDQYLSIAFPSFSTKYCLTSFFVCISKI